MATANLSRMLDWARYRFGDKDALVFEGRRWTYAELDHDVNAMAAGLLAMGVGREDRLAMLSMNLPECLIVALALAKIGAVLLPLNYRLHVEELEYLLNHSGAIGLATEPEYEAVSVRLVARNPALRHRLALTDGMDPAWTPVPGLIAKHAGTRVPDAEMQDNDLQRILYTSGTTSRPKGARITHGNVNANMNAQVVDLGLTSAERLLNFAPLYHVGGLDLPGYATWYVGGTMLLTRRFDPESILDLISNEHATGMAMVATMLRMLRAHPGIENYDTTSVRWMVFGQVNVGLFDETRELFPNARLIEGYGLTETVNGLSYLDQAHMFSKPGSVGRPLHGVDLRVVDDDDVPVPAGERGEIVARGPKVCDGYLSDPEATAQAFRGGWFHTGDIGMFDEDGYLYIVDRKKDMIRSGGENIASAEIERVLSDIPGVHEAAVVGAPHPKWLEVPVAFMVSAPGRTLDAEAVIEHCRGELGRFKTPAAIYEMDELPHNPSGKVLKRELREMLDDLVPAWAAQATAER
jgi:fatty-acyl-CoA synthase